MNECSESRAPYDITISPRGSAPHRGGGGKGHARTVFIEVKTTRYLDNNVMELSYCEWQFLSAEPPVQYHIYRVSGAGDPNGARLTVIENTFQAIQNGLIRLCMAV